MGGRRLDGASRLSKAACLAKRDAGDSAELSPELAVVPYESQHPKPQHPSGCFGWHRGYRACVCVEGSSAVEPLLQQRSLAANPKA